MSIQSHISTRYVAPSIASTFASAACSQPPRPRPHPTTRGSVVRGMLRKWTFCGDCSGFDSATAGPGNSAVGRMAPQRRTLAGKRLRQQPEPSRTRWAASLQVAKSTPTVTSPATARWPSPCHGLAVCHLDASRRNRLALSPYRRRRSTRRPDPSRLELFVRNPRHQRPRLAAGAQPTEQLIDSPAFSVEARVAPWLRLNWWATDLGDATCYVEWTTKTTRNSARIVAFNFHPLTSHDIKTDIRNPHDDRDAPTPGMEGRHNRSADRFRQRLAAQVVIKSLHTSSDTRITVNNPNFIRACHDYFLWSLDQEFLSQPNRSHSPGDVATSSRVPRARAKVHLHNWPGHEGRSGVLWVDG